MFNGLSTDQIDVTYSDIINTWGDEPTVVKNDIVIERLEDGYTVGTLEGEYRFTDKDVLIIGIQNEVYPCKIDIFEETYDILN